MDGEWYDERVPEREYGLQHYESGGGYSHILHSWDSITLALR
jgi:hypothetical protein